MKSVPVPVVAALAAVALTLSLSAAPIPPPGFEAASSTVARARAALDDIAARHAGACVLVISHGGVLRLLQTEFTGSQQRFPNLSGSWFEHSEHHGWTMGSLLFPLQRVAPDGTVE